MKTTPKPTPKPKVGQTVTVHGVKCTIFKVHPFGTLDVVTLDGTEAYRLTGLVIL